MALLKRVEQITMKASTETTGMNREIQIGREGHARPADRWILWLVLAELIVLYLPTVRWLVDRWTMSVWHNAHGLIIPFVVAYFVWLELRDQRGGPETASAWGFAFLVPALGLHALDAGIHTELASAVSLVLTLPGLALLFLGVRRTRAIAFPLAFSAFMLPIPLALTEGIHLRLREIAMATSARILPLVGVPVFTEGTTLHLPNASLFLGDACSGFSTLYAAVAIACLVAQSSPNMRRSVVVLLAAVPLAIGANVVRVVLLALLVIWRGEAVLSTWLHPASGMLTFALALPAIFWLGSLRSQPSRTA